MISDLMSLVDKFVGVFKKRIYGKTFFCPVCHLELSFMDADQNDCLVCPLCGVVIELHETYGHAVPIVNDVEINRVQPKMRLHPMATHLPLGLYPFAMLGTLLLLFTSVISLLANTPKVGGYFFSTVTPLLDNAILIFLFLSVFSSALTFLTGVVDWKYRYGGRSYRVITLKLVLSALFLALGVAILLLHPLVFEGGIVGLASVFDWVVAVLYYALILTGMLVLATLGHVGGYLVFGK